MFFAFLFVLSGCIELTCWFFFSFFLFLVVKVKLTRDLDGITCTLPAATRNMYVDGK